MKNARKRTISELVDLCSFFWEKSPDCVKILDSRGNIEYMNSAGAKEHGFKSPKDAVGENYFKLLSPRHRSVCREKFKECLLGKKGISFEVHHATGRSDRNWCSLVATPILGEKGKVERILCISRDISNLKKKEEEVRASREYYEGLVETSPDAIVVYVDGEIVMANKSAVKLAGAKSKSELVGKPALSFVHPEYRDFARKRIAKVLKERESVPLAEEKFVRLDGEVIYGEVISVPVTYHGKPACQSIIRIITERKKVEDELKKERDKARTDEARTEALLGSIGEGIAAIDSFGRIAFVNRAAEKLLGRESKNIVGEAFEEILRLEDEKGNPVPKKEMPLWIALETGKRVSVGALETKYYARNEDKFPVAVVATPVILNSGVIGAVVVFRDVTEEKRIDEAKTEFVSLASHQLLTPISSIKWYLEMVLAGEVGTLTDGQKKYLETVYRSSRRMAELVNSLLNVSRIEMGTFSVKPEKVNLSQLADSVLREVVRAVEEAGKKKPKIIKKYADGVPRIKADPNLMRIVLQNLLSNAVKFTPWDGKVEFSLIREGSEVLVTVSDNGYGIPKKDQNRIFTKLFRAENIRALSPEGTGLGLYTTKAVVEASGGKIWFDSKEGKGTTFFVKIPIEGVEERIGTRTLV